MKIELKEKEVKAIMNAVKISASATGEEIVSTWDMLRNIYSSNSKLFSIVPDFRTGNVTIEVNEEYISEGMNIYNRYLPLIVANVMSTITLCTNLYGDIESLAKELSKKNA